MLTGLIGNFKQVSAQESGARLTRMGVVTGEWKDPRSRARVAFYVLFVILNCALCSVSFYFSVHCICTFDMYSTFEETCYTLSQGCQFIMM